jgi:hypothetical protein
MPDVLTPAEQAAIAAYRGPVTIIPRGVSSEATYAYSETTTASGGLASSNRTMSHKAWLRERVKASHRARAKVRAFQALKRRETPAEVVETTTVQALVMVTPPLVTPTVKPKLKAARFRIQKSRSTGAMARRTAAALERQAVVRAMILDGQTRPAVAKALSLSWSTIGNDIAALRKRGELPPPNEARSRCHWSKRVAAE